MQRSAHFEAVLKERGIADDWVEEALAEPDRVEERADGTHHYLKRIDERGGRWLRVVLNVKVQPRRAVTVFFDRRLRGDP